MSKLDEISVRVESNRPRTANIEIATGILRDVHSALREFQASGRPQAIDLRHQRRMTEATYNALEQALSRGEVSAIVDSELRAEIFETRFSGVWWVRHLDEQGEITTEIIEVTEVPVILKAHRIDMIGALKKLEQFLETPLANDMMATPTELERSASQ
ncbi:MAG: hydrogenase expression/formation C-terminal domain-containing protein [Azonexus sp.]|nr:hydrogenase expression/formation C-terminal domain-containing protein [Azonexus sp.]